MARRLAEVEEIAANALEALRRHRVSIESAYLFGSYLAGTATPDSDIDIAVFSTTVDNMRLEVKLDLLAQVEKEVGAEVEIHLFASRRLAEARPTNLYGHILKVGKKIA